MAEKYFGLIPAAGRAMRMRPFRYPKELLPVHFEHSPGSEFIRPKLLIEYSMEALRLASVNDLYVIVPEWKPELMRYLEDGKHFGHNISYLYNSKALGLADALWSAYPWLNDKITCFAMPDTVFSPSDAFVDILEMMYRKNADLVLGVFPNDEASHFAPVEFDSDGKVLNIWEKPIVPLFNNSWGIAVWSSRFWKYFASLAAGLEPGISITQTFDQAAKDGLKIYCKYFEDGWYKDMGRINDLSAIRS